MTFGTLVMLVLLATFLIICFDWIASRREQLMVEQGFQRLVEQYEGALVPQADWDDAVTHLDHKFDTKFADVNFGSQLYTFNGVTHTFFLDGAGGVLYASVDGKHAEKSAFRPFAQIAATLLAPVRRAEAARPPIKPVAGDGLAVTKPIQANGVVRIGNEVYIVIATLIQPDLGRVLPKGRQAPVVITAMPITKRMLRAFASRYLVDDLEIEAADSHRDDANYLSLLLGKAHFRLRSPSGAEIAALAWTPRRPGVLLLEQLKWPLLAALVLLAFAGWVLIRRCKIIVDELILSEEQARHLAHHDQLTGVPNRVLLFEQLPRLLASAGQDTPMVVVLGIDLDHFKEVNDTMGHHAGDRLLKTLAERLQAATQPYSTSLIARLGGDEFIIACPVKDRKEAEDLARRCLDSTMQPIRCGYGTIDVGCSIGGVLIANAEDSAAGPSAILRRADLALYESKAGGRGCVTFFEPAMEDSLHSRRTLEKNLREALSGDDFHMAYQPQVNFDGAVSAVESLLRWNHPELGAVSPAVFVPLAEETGLIMAIGEFVMRRVFEETAHWHHLRVAINVSAVQMRTPGYAAQVMQLAARAGIDPRRYEIELTETALLGDGPATIENFDILRRLGFSIVLDDFGTGYSSLSLLHRFRVDKIKIDRSFVTDLGKSGEVNALVAAIVKLARSFKLGVIAEGVETEEQRQLLTLAGCTEFQGFLTGAPMPASHVAARYQPDSASRRIA